MDDEEFIKKFVTSYEIENNRFSCLILALTDARKLSLFDNASRKLELDFFENRSSFINPFSFSSVITYLLILDMLGEIFITNINNTNKIFSTLKEYSSLNERDINAIVALRNSLAHNYGLINIPMSDKKNLSQRHKFMLIADRTTNIIDYPSVPWTGNFKDKSDYSFTRVGLVNLFELVETVYDNLKAEVIKDPLGLLSLKDGVSELKARFTISY